MILFLRIYRIPEDSIGFLRLYRITKAGLVRILLDSIRFVRFSPIPKDSSGRLRIL